MSVSGVAAASVTVRVATFNIELFSGSPTQTSAATAILSRIGAEVVCVQEIQTQPALNLLATQTDLTDLGYPNGYPHQYYVSLGTACDDTLHLGILSVYPISARTETAVTLSGDPTARDIVRNFVVAEVDVPNAAQDLVIIGNHWKSGGEEDDNEYRRSIESFRAMQIAAGYDSTVIPYFIVGDMNDDISDSPDSPSNFTSEPGGLPSCFNRGNDITFPLPNGVFKPFQAGTGVQHLTVINALQLAGFPLDATRISSGRRLDYLWRSDAVTVVGSEVYDSNDDCQGLVGLPKHGSQLACSTSGTASDHLLVFVDVAIADAGPLGACCLSDGSCTEVTALDCQDLLGVWRGQGVACGTESPPCDAGACCLAGGTCDDTLTETQCLNQAGTFKGATIECGEEVPPCSSGACCWACGCDDLFTQTECLNDLNGTFVGFGVACAEAGCPELPNNFLINEVMADPDGGPDRLEFVEVVGPASTSPCGVSILVIEGEGASKGVVDLVVSLDDCGGEICELDSNGYFVAGGLDIVNRDLLIGLGENILERGTQTVALVRDCAVGIGQDIDANDDGVEDVFVGTILDGIGLIDAGYPADDKVYFGVPTFGPFGTVMPPGAARCPNAVDTDTVGDWVMLGGATDGSDGYAWITPKSANASCDGDYDADGDVDLFDFHVFQQCFDPIQIVTATCYAGDMNGDQRVDLDDLEPFVDRLEGN